MTRDWQTGTELDAAKADRATAWDDRERDRDEETVRIVENDDHRCDGPACDRLLCVLDRTVARQKRETDPLWQEHVAEQNREWNEGEAG